ncbi:MAG: acylphosphatase [Oenococcus sp.]|uniref:acylphosphatase n=1 Tax=Oenococcus sp. TaxID=1979414 RepID=UPI0039E87415
MSLSKKIKDLLHNQPPKTENQDDPAATISGDGLVRFHLLFSGRVQQVGFRYEAQQLAITLKLTGWVKNLFNGQVEMEIQGQPEKIESLINQLSTVGWIRIDRVERQQLPVDRQEKQFIVTG